MEAYRVILSYLATGTITQVCFMYACTANFMPVQLWCWQVFIHVQMCDSTTRQILFIFGITPICVASYLEYYNVYTCVYI